MSRLFTVLFLLVSLVAAAGGFRVTPEGAGYLEKPPGWNGAAGCFFVENHSGFYLELYEGQQPIQVLGAKYAGGDMHVQKTQKADGSFAGALPPVMGTQPAIFYGQFSALEAEAWSVNARAYQRSGRQAAQLATSTADINYGLVVHSWAKRPHKIKAIAGAKRMKPGDLFDGCYIVKFDDKDFQ